jgi:hypothetical protein
LCAEFFENSFELGVLSILDDQRCDNCECHSQNGHKNKPGAPGEWNQLKLKHKQAGSGQGRLAFVSKGDDTTFTFRAVFFRAASCVDELMNCPQF